MLQRWFIFIGAPGVWACSHFTMDNEYVISARTEDLGHARHAVVLTKPQGSAGLRASKYGYVAIKDSNIRSGMNHAGLMCDKQTLEVATHPPPKKELDNIDAGKICQWGLEGFGSVEDLKIGLKGVNFIKSEDPDFALGHWAFRDAAGKGLVLEFTNHSMQVYDDNNDGGVTGYGIMTNDPPLPEHWKNIAELKRQLQTAPLTLKMPGGWTPEDRFKRIFLIKTSLQKPSNVQEALMQAVHTINSVSGPTNAPLFGLEGAQTQWAAVYDQKNGALYWRSYGNQNLQRVRLADMDIGEGGVETQLLVNSSTLPWFTDAKSLFQPKETETLLTI